MDVELILDARNATGESPVWSCREQALYWVDIPARRLFRWDPASRTSQSWEAPEMLACIAASPDGGWIAGMESGLFRLTADLDGKLQCIRLVGVNHLLPGMRFNDGRCDRQGRFWAGTMQIDITAGAAAGALYRYDGGQSTPLESRLGGLIVPNGLAFSPDGKVMYLSDSHPSVQLIWAFDYDIDSGTPYNRRIFVDMNNYPGRPDGAAIDTDGCYWICANDAGMIHRFTPQGRLERSITLPVKKPTMCAFGGRNLETLYVTSIRPSGDLSDQPLAGGVFAIHPGISGLGETLFSGSPW
ncbi:MULTISPECIES: SMP-30/gluconolactonase/LRE family protein [unclassified Pseudomonas]|uniref:SMP-30/gluconolactonase/LRE family protein n=1 Tax=unclassified Pseudomonas TaxID=196821 RepID=UPI000C2F89C1|nr:MULTISPECIES: SMP-30/gluconolactonase/LRE family protein [unclassified Pseudomonas]MCU1739304.1 SMP-30/gluconolactonase/LRE family protein [Pseudomonas sp. 20S_6.2_Bac1]